MMSLPTHIALNSLLLGAICLAAGIAFLTSRHTLLKANYALSLLSVLLLCWFHADWVVYLMAMVQLSMLVLIHRDEYEQFGFLRTSVILTQLLALSGLLLFDVSLYYFLFLLLVGYCADITAFWQYYRALLPIADNEDSAEPDVLGLPNRLVFQEAFKVFRLHHVEQAMLVMVQLQGFEQVNLHLGREFGDLLLTQSAKRIKQHVKSNDVMSIEYGNQMSKVAHLGGLHFVFVCMTHRQRHLHEQIIDDILRNTLAPFNIGQCTMEITARASYVDCDEELGKIEKLIACAYLALDSAPDKRVCPYQQRFQIDKLEQQARLSELANLDFKREFKLYFQPIVRHHDSGIEFVELLLRWQHPKQGILAAVDFIEDIRLAGLARPLAEFVIERAAEIAMAMRIEGVATPVSINVFGPEMLDESFIEYVDNTLLSHKLVGSDIIIECPATMLLELDDEKSTMITRLKGLGVRLCVDGLGSSAVPLAGLPKLQSDFVKLAQVMTQDYLHHGNFKALVKGLVELHSVDSKVICEGIETDEQLGFAKGLNSFAGQGYLYSRPLSSNGLISWVKQWQLEH